MLHSILTKSSVRTIVLEVYIQNMIYGGVLLGFRDINTTCRGIPNEGGYFSLGEMISPSVDASKIRGQICRAGFIFSVIKVCDDDILQILWSGQVDKGGALGEKSLEKLS